MVHKVLLQCPLLDEHGKAWKPLNDDKTLRSYAMVLVQLIQSLLLSVSNHNSTANSTAYQYPISPSLSKVLKALEQALLTNSPTLEMAIHNLAFCLFSPQNHMQETGDYNKWNDPMEYFIAIHNLTLYGNFKSPKNVTQLFATLEYLIRETTLYEGNSHAKATGADYYQSVTDVAMTTIHAGIISPFNAVIHYQQWASALSYASTSPPITRVSKDGLDITYGTSILNVPKWHQGLHQLHIELETALAQFLYRKSFGLSQLTSMEDDWANDNYGYSWMDEAARHITGEWDLLGHMLMDQDLKLATASAEGTFLWNKLALMQLMQRCNKFVWQLGFFGFATNGQASHVAEFVEHKIHNSHHPQTIFQHGTDLWMPLEALFASVLWGPETAQLYQQYLFMNMESPITPEHYQKFFFDTTAVFPGSRIGARDYRHLTVEIAQIYIGPNLTVDIDDNNILAAQRGHTAQTAW
ncbi:hypothetical protein AN958_09420 [Leucoagaricus sp. SymC.cos]|nr:hypothetical protein AN958_09420 [Leucoagaricus sp. SymC.cos]